MASEVLQTISRDEAERFRLLSELKYELDTQSKLVYAKREAMKEGMKQGEKRGEKKAKVKVARNALAEGASVEFVGDITGLDIETIRNIQAKLSKSITK